MVPTMVKLVDGTEGGGGAMRMEPGEVSSRAAIGLSDVDDEPAVEDMDWRASDEVCCFLRRSSLLLNSAAASAFVR